MMYNYPFFSFPYSRRYYYSYSSRVPVSVSKKSNKNSSGISKEFYNTDLSANNNSSSSPTHQSHYGLSFLDNLFNQQDRSKDESYFDLFGLKLYNDDILLIGLIFFLYKENVKDQYLFIALILLLLS